MENLQTTGFQTSVELAKKHPSTTSTAAAGSKRTQEQRSPLSPQSARGRFTLPSPSIATRPFPTNSGFVRPTLQQSSAGQIRASTIYDADPFSGGISASSPRGHPSACPASTPGVTQNPLLNLGHPIYGLPESLVRSFSRLGIHAIYPWQSSCLLGRGLLTGEKNLVYAAPTGGGKSLVADVLLLKRVIDRPGKKAILVLPYVALVQEKLRWLRSVVEGVHKSVGDNDNGSISKADDASRRKPPSPEIRVAGFFGGSKTRLSLADVDIAVCTIEKANSMVNAAIEACTIADLGVLVLDELHMLQDDHRGYLLELMATKLLSLEQDTQIIGMSATLSNTAELARWLNAKFYESKYRPIPIEEYLVYDNNIYSAADPGAFLKPSLGRGSSEPQASLLKPCRKISPSQDGPLRSPIANAVVALAIETASAGFGVLVFCGSRKGCELTADLVCQATPAEADLDPATGEARRELLHDLRSISVELEPTLERTVVRGVAFHHAGLTTEERDIIVNAFDRGIIRIIVATCSLAAGINLPARRVILHGARMGRDLVGPAMLRQMKGRAGRKGKDELGETYLCCDKRDLEAIAQLLEADLPVVQSCLTPEKRGVNRALLEVVATGLATSREAVDEYMKHTLFANLSDTTLLSQTVESAAESLVASRLVTIEQYGTLKSTLLGQAIVAASLTPEDGLFIHDEIQRALQAFVMDGDMHIFYMFTPIQPSGLGDVNWRIFRDQIDKMHESDMRVLQYVGVMPGTVNRMAQGGTLRETTPEEAKVARVYRRFYAALQLRDLSNEMPVHQVARKYDTPRGAVQNLAQTCEGFAAGMIKFCERIGWGMLAAVLSHMSDRLKAGARADLLELAQIAFVKSRTARVFWENGLRSVRAVAEAEPKDLIPILLQVQPEKVRRLAQEEQKYRAKVAAKADVIIKSANRLWNQQMQLDVED